LEKRDIVKVVAMRNLKKNSDLKVKKMSIHKALGPYVGSSIRRSCRTICTITDVPL